MTPRAETGQTREDVGMRPQFGMYWKCWRCSHDQHFAGPIEPVELEHLTCERCGAHESIDPTEGAPDNEQVLAGQQQIPGIARFPDPPRITTAPAPSHDAVDEEAG